MEQINHNDISPLDDPLKGIKQPLVSPIRTFRTDLIDIARSGNQSLAQLVVKAQERKRQQANQEIYTIDSLEKKKKVLKTAILLFLLIPIVILIGYLAKDSIGLSPRSEQIVNSIIVPDTYFDMSANISSDSFLPALRQHIKNKIMNPGEVEHIFFTHDIIRNEEEKVEVLPVKDFLTLWSENIPSILTRSLVPDAYMFGIYQVPDFSKKAHFLIMRTQTADNARAGMLRWEARMFDDLHALFDLPDTAVGSFTDQLMENRGVRVLTDFNDRPILIYTVLDDNTIVITDSPEALRQIFFRLRQKSALLQ